MNVKVNASPPGGKPRLLVLVGPTAVGKTKLSLELAKRYGCEIISGDSMQVYRGMDVGTAKIKPEEMDGVPHHMIDIADPDEISTAADFQEKAAALIAAIGERGKLPFIVGGTGLYIESLCYGFRFTEGGSDEAFRQEQELFLAEHGEAGLHERLKAVDPVTAGRLHPNDYRRVIRALEVAHLTGKPLSEHLADQVKESPYDLCIVGLTMDRALLYKRIEQRIDLMIEEGLIAEVQSLLRSGYRPNLVSMQALGYKEIVKYLRGLCTLEESVRLLKRNTRRFAKRQLSWFRHMPAIQWVDIGDTANFTAHLHKINGIISAVFGLEEQSPLL